MSWWTDFRDTAESIGGLVANYFYPGTIALGKLVNSKGSQEQLFGTSLGQIATLGSSLGGLYAGMGGSAVGGTGAGDIASTGGDFENIGSIAGGNVASNRSYDDLFQEALSRGIPESDAHTYALEASQGGNQNIIGGYGNTGNAGQPGGVSGTQTIGGGGGGSPYKPIFQPAAAKSAGVMPWNSPAGIANIASSGIGLMGAAQMGSLAQDARKQADPFGPYREQYAKMMQDITNDPSKIEGMPGYKAGMRAVQRSMASQGYQGSGNMMAAMAKYGGDFYDKMMGMYGGLSGAQFNPAAAAQLGLQGTGQAYGLASQSLGSLGYGMMMNQFDPYQYQQRNNNVQGSAGRIQ